MPLHLQRKVLAWSRGPNAEEAVAPPPSALASGATAAAAVGDDVNVQLNSGTVAFNLNGNSSSSGASDAAEAAFEADLADSIAAAASVGSTANLDATSTTAAAAAAAEQNGNGVVAAAPANLVLEAVVLEASEPVASSDGIGSSSQASIDPAGSAPAESAPAALLEAPVEAPVADTTAAAAAEAAAEVAATAAPKAAGTAAEAPAAADQGATVPAAAAEAAVVAPSSPAEAEEAAVAESLAAEAAAAAEAEAALAASSSGSSDASSAAGSDVPSSSSSSSSGEGPASGNGVGGPAIRLVFSSGAAMLPHPDKASRGGEDSFFIADHQAAVGVADGVGGWAEIGVDAGAYARLLMVHAKEAADAAADDVAAGTLSAQAILESAFYRTNVQGSSTACVLVVNGTTLSASNLGDSGFVLVRDGAATFQCPQQQHNFNFPFQLGSADSMSDQPQAAMRFELQVQPGDIIVTGSDGLWDNIFAEEAATIASKCRDKGETATTAAQVLCRYARMRASDAKYHSPFSYAAIQAGYVYLGGKMDDITVVVSYVTLPSRV